MPEQIDVGAFVAEHERHFKFKDKSLPYVFVPCSDRGKRQGMLISFGSWMGGYNRIRGYYEQFHETHDMLYMEDINGFESKGAWYLCQDGDFWLEETYTAMLEKIIGDGGVDKKNIYTFGSSMGGFAALYYSFKLGLGKAVAICPSINVKARPPHGNPEIYRRIMPDPDFDMRGYIFKMFDQAVPTESHLIINRQDDSIVTAGLELFISMLIKHQNRFTVASYDIEAEGITPHNATMFAAGQDAVVDLFNTSLSVKAPE